MPVNLLLAPHHDDVLLSLPGALLAARAERAAHAERPAPTKVVVCFSDEDAALARTCDELHGALALDVQPLGFVEARRRGESLRQCLRGDRALPELASHPLVPVLAEALRRVVGEHDDVVLWVPLLAVHMDHGILRLAAERIQRPRIYYQDQPYASTYARSLARSTQGLQPLGSSACRASREDVAGLLNGLSAFMTERQLARIVADYERAGQRTWRAEEGPS